MAEFALETNYPSKTNYPTETDNWSKYKLDAKTNYGAKFV